MRFLVTSDLQWSDNPRDDYRHGFVAVLKKLIEKHRPEWLFLLGDLTEGKDNHSAWLVNMVVKHLVELSQMINLLIMRGNHDYKDIQQPFFQFIGRFNRVRWVNGPGTMTFNKRDTFLFLPHTRNHEDDWNEKWFKDVDYIFAHNIFDGTTSANGHKLRGIPTNIFPEGAKVFSGDVHEPQTIGPVTYVGSPYLCDYGDDYEPRVLLLDGDRVTSIQIKGPQKRLIEWTYGNTDFKFLDHANKGDIIKLRISITARDMAGWAETKKRLHEFAKRDGIILDTIQPIVEYKAGKVASTYEAKTDKEQLADYAKRRGLDEKTIEAGNSLLNED